MTYPEDVLKAAREAAIAALWRPSDEAQRRNIRNGYGDHYSEVQAACIAIMAERQRCAGIAAQEAHNAASSASKVAVTAIACTILGQQEGA